MRPASPKSATYIFSVCVFLLSLLACAPSASTLDLYGRVVEVRDGDTIDVLVEGDMVFRVRLEGVDCPEKDQEFAVSARRFTSGLLLRKNVRVVQKDKDDYGRIVGRVLVAGKDASKELVKAGLAWHYKYYSEDPVLADLERQARAAQIGLWSMPNPMPPWEYRSNVLGRRLESGQVYHGNVRSRVFHHPDCPQYNCRNCLREFRSRKGAMAAGYRPCGICKP